MPRAMLRDDYGRGPVSCLGVSLDDDSQSSVPISLDPSDGHTPGVPAGSLYPTVTVRERVTTGLDDDGNPKWSWIDTVKDVEAIYWVDRTESSDRGEIAVEKADITFLYPKDFPPVRESASVLTSDGKRWSIEKVDRFPDRIQLTVQRIDSYGQ